jgi:IS30 family transposase
MNKQYRHLSVEDRAVIMIEAGKGMSLRAIDRTLGRNVSTVSRELKRAQHGHVEAALGSVTYDAAAASAAYRERHKRCGRRCKLVKGTALYQ